MEAIRKPVLRELAAVNRLIIDNLKSDVDLVENVGHYIVAGGGKRLRPILALLSACCCGYQGNEHIRFAAVVEFIHTATLLHDDVVDISSLRRGRPTANAEFGNASSVLVGDFLYTRAFQLLVEIGDMKIMREMAGTTNMIAAGEVLQLVRAGKADITEAQYFDVVTRKTAVLFAAACYGAAPLAGRDEETANTLHEFGLNIGIAFQIIDDVLDYEGDPVAMGKNVGDDLSEGKATLPLIHTIREGEAAAAELVANAIRNKSARHIVDVLRAVTDTGSLEYARQVAMEYQAKALAQLQRLPDNPYREALSQVANLAIRRSH